MRVCVRACVGVCGGARHTPALPWHAHKALASSSCWAGGCVNAGDGNGRGGGGWGATHTHGVWTPHSSGSQKKGARRTRCSATLPLRPSPERVEGTRKNHVTTRRLSGRASSSSEEPLPMQKKNKTKKKSCFFSYPKTPASLHFRLGPNPNSTSKTTSSSGKKSFPRKGYRRLPLSRPPFPKPLGSVTLSARPLGSEHGNGAKTRQRCCLTPPHPPGPSPLATMYPPALSRQLGAERTKIVGAF